MMPRDKIRTVFRRQRLSAPPVSVRLDLWHRDAEARGTLPAAWRGLRQEEVEDMLGFARAARYRMGPHLIFPGIEITRETQGDDTIERYCFPERALTRVTCATEAMRRAGMGGHVTRYPLEGEDDYRLLLRHLDNASLSFRLDDFDAFTRETGDRGLPMLIAGSCPFHLLLLQYAGYEQFYLHRADFPETVDAMHAALEAIFRRDLWPALASSSAELVMHGNHFSSQMTPPPVFERYYLPYFTDFNALMHAQGKYTLWHADAEMGQLLPHVLRAGFDGADCLATHPLVPTRLEDYLAAWQGKIVCWGGLPGIIFSSEFPLPDYKAFVLDLLGIVRDRTDIILGASDNVMPGAEWERLEFLADVTG